jgi:four helix bundle protein
VPIPAGITPSNDLIITLDARDANIDFLVTGDRGMLEQATNFDVPALSPRNFLQLIEGGGDSYPTLPGEGEGPLVSEPKDNPVRDQAYTFALDIIRLYQQLQDHREYVISKQLLRSGTSIGANVEEATAAESRRDFLHKMKIAMKESRETLYWLRLLDQSDLAPGVDVQGLLQQCTELSAILTSITKTTSENLARY